MMITSAINKYCDTMINIHKYIKSIINNIPFEQYILNMTRRDALEYFSNHSKSIHNMYLTRSQRHKLYKLLKGKDSNLIVYSYGNENKYTKKYVVIKK